MYLVYIVRWRKKSCWKKPYVFNIGNAWRERTTSRSILTITGRLTWRENVGRRGMSTRTAFDWTITRRVYWKKITSFITYFMMQLYVAPNKICMYPVKSSKLPRSGYGLCWSRITTRWLSLSHGNTIKKSILTYSRHSNGLTYPWLVYGLNWMTRVFMRWAKFFKKIKVYIINRFKHWFLFW